MNALQKLERVQSRLDAKSKEIDNLRRELIRSDMNAIFEALGISARCELNYLSHTSNNVTVSAQNKLGYGVFDGHPGTNKKPYFSVESVVNGIEIKLNVIDHTVPQLALFKKLIEIKE